MSEQASTIEILIDIRSRLQAIEATQRDMKQLASDTRDANRAATELRTSMSRLEGMAKLGAVFAAAGLSLQSFTAAVLGAIGTSAKLAAEAERAGGRLGLSAEAYQVLAASARDAGTEFTELLSGMQQYRQRLGDALADPKAGGALDALKLSAQALAALPLERQMEKIAVALGGVADENRRAAITADLFGRGGASLLPVLETLRVQGFDKLRATVEQTHGVLKNGLAGALDTVGDRAAAAQNRLGVAMAGLNMRLLETKARIAELLADAGGSVGSGLEAAMTGALVMALVKAASKAGVSAAVVTSFGSLGTKLGTPFGAAFAAAAGMLIIREIERVILDAMGEENAAGDAALQRMRERTAKTAATRTPEDQAKLRAQFEAELAQLRAPNVPARVRQTILNGEVLEGDEIPARFDAAKLTEAQKSEITNLETKIALLKSATAARIAERGAASDAATAARIAAEAAALKELADAEDAAAAAATALLARQAALQAGFDDNQPSWEMARQVVEANLTPLERYNRELDRLIQLADKLPEDVLGRARTAAQATYDAAQAAAVDKKLRAFFGGMDEPKDEPPKESRRASGLAEGAGAWVEQLGTQGEQVASSLQNTLGAAVSSISDGIYGWITGANTFGDAMRNLAGNVLQIALHTIVQMGVQWLVSAALGKSSMLSLSALGAGLRKAEAVDTIGTETAKTPSLATNAALASAGSFGLSAVLGIALLSALVGAFAAGGFSSGGYTGAGGRDDPAGVVHAGEVVFSQRDVANFGGVAALENLRIAGPRATAVNAPSLSVSAALAGGGGGGNTSSKPQRDVWIVGSALAAKNLQRDPAWETFIVDVVGRRRGELLG